MGGLVAVGGEGDAAIEELLGQGRRVLTFDDPENRRLLDMGAEPVAPGQVPV